MRRDEIQAAVTLACGACSPELIRNITNTVYDVENGPVVAPEDEPIGERRSVPGTNLYASDQGRIWILADTIGWIRLPERKSLGYPSIAVPVQCMVHKLVASAFLGDRPKGHHIDHKDEDKTNNKPGNLQYLSPKLHRVKTIRTAREKRIRSA